MVAEWRKVHHIFKFDGGGCQVGQFIVTNHTTFVCQSFYLLRLRFRQFVRTSPNSSPIHSSIFFVEMDFEALRAFFVRLKDYHWRTVNSEQVSLFADRCHG